MNQSKTSASYTRRERDDTCIENIAWLAARSVLQSYNDTETFFGLLQALACGMIRHYHSHYTMQHSLSGAVCTSTGSQKEPLPASFTAATFT